MNIEQYKELSEKTLSEKFHVENDAVKAAALQIVSNYLHAAKQLDYLKKVIFYGREPELLGDDFNAEIEAKVAALDDADLKQQKVLHGAIGVATESAEILEQVFGSIIARQEFDVVNIGEEVGDTMWYNAIFLREFDLDFEKILKVNIDKLAKRYGDKFSEYNATNRDLDAERDILES